MRHVSDSQPAYMHLAMHARQYTLLPHFVLMQTAAPVMHACMLHSMPKLWHRLHSTSRMRNEHGARSLPLLWRAGSWKWLVNLYQHSRTATHVCMTTTALLAAIRMALAWSTAETVLCSATNALLAPLAAEQSSASVLAFLAARCSV